MPEPRFFVAGALAAVVLSGLGLVASFFHLGHPERAWRAASRWRTSWLSREVIALPAFIGGVTAYGAAHAFGWTTSPWLGFLTLVACIALFVCTGMVYACIRFLQEWASPLTLVNFFLLGPPPAARSRPCSRHGSRRRWSRCARRRPSPRHRGAGGSRGLARAQRTLAAQILAADGDRHQAPAHRAESAGLHGRLLQHARVLSRRIEGQAARDQVGVPGADLSRAGALAARGNGQRRTVRYGLAFFVQYTGLLAERWFFFAQANHPQNLYYQAIS